MWSTLLRWDLHADGIARPAAFSLVEVQLAWYMVGIAGVVGPVVDADPAQSLVSVPAPMQFVSAWLRLNAGLAAGRQNGLAI